MGRGRGAGPKEETEVKFVALLTDLQYKFWNLILKKISNIDNLKHDLENIRKTL